MKEKVIIIKDICKIILSLIIIISVCKSCANAKTLTVTEIENFILNGYKYHTNVEPTQEIINNVIANEEQWYKWAQLSEQYEGRWIIWNERITTTQTKTYFYYYTGGESNLTKYGVYIYNNSINVNSSYLQNSSATYATTTNTYSDFQTSRLNQLGSSQYRFLYSDTTVRNKGTITQATVTYYEPGDSDPDENLFAENYISSAKWEFIPAYTKEYTISGDNKTYYRVSKDFNNSLLGEIVDSPYVSAVMIDYYAYDKNKNSWENVYYKVPYNEATGQQQISDVFYTYIENNLQYSQITVPSNLITENMIIELMITPEEFAPVNENINRWFYVVGQNTLISGDKINVTGTFTDNYYNDYKENVNEQVNEQNNPVVDQLKENQTWLEKAYDKMFKVPSGEVEKLVNQVIDKIPVDSGEILETTKVLNFIKQNPDDFKITWQSYNPHFSVKNIPIASNNGYMIPSGEVNFSKIERETPEFQQTMRWVRIILNLAMIGVIVNAWYRILLACFGVPLELYPQAVDKINDMKNQNRAVKQYLEHRKEVEKK